ncbi:MAG: hypothetical protein IJT66_03470, partial [Clostridia bacterium]|nr:hypothetical protein [Clostridia bacterium]
MIMETRYKDRPAVALESRELRAVFLPEDGAKLASLCFGEKELLEQAKGIEYLRLHRNSEYVTCECSAFDDMFPTIDPCILNGHFYPDHGEVCRIPHTCLVTQNKVFFTCCSESVNADFSKSVWVEANALFIQYRIHNRNESPLPYLWAGHMMFAGSCGARVIS